MELEQKRRIDEIKAGMECSKGFECCKDGATDLSKARDRGMEGFVECLDQMSGVCKFRIPFGNGAFCKCPLRVYITKELGK